MIPRPLLIVPCLLLSLICSGCTRTPKVLSTHSIQLPDWIPCSCGVPHDQPKTPGRMADLTIEMNNGRLLCRFSSLKAIDLYPVKVDDHVVWVWGEEPPEEEEQAGFSGITPFLNHLDSQSGTPVVLMLQAPAQAPIGPVLAIHRHLLQDPGIVAIEFSTFCKKPPLQLCLEIAPEGSLTNRDKQPLAMQIHAKRAPRPDQVGSNTILVLNTPANQPWGKLIQLQRLCYWAKDTGINRLEITTTEFD